MNKVLHTLASLLILLSVLTVSAGAFDRIVLHEGFTSTT